MELNRSQKKYLKKNSKRLSLGELAKNLNLDEKELSEFLKRSWRKEKFQKFANRSPVQQIKKEDHRTDKWPGLLNFVHDKRFIIVLLISLVALGYINSLNNNFLSDDISGIKENSKIGQFSALAEKPLSFLRDLFYLIIYKIFGLQPLFFRVLNIFFHLGSVLTVFLITSLLATPIVALISASIFAVHPLTTEAVTWISGGPYTQYGFFFLLSFSAYLISERTGSKKVFFLAVLFFILSLLSTEKALVLPFIFLVYEFSFGKLSHNWQRAAPFFLLSAIFLFAFLVRGALGGRVSVLQNQYYTDSSSLYNPLVQIPTAISSYLELSFFPKSLSFYHSEMIFGPIEYTVRALTTLVFLAALIYFFKKDKLVFFGLAFFAITLLPTLTPLKIGWVVAERYVYLGLAGLIISFSALIEKLLTYFRLSKLLLPLAGIILLCLMIRTIVRNNDWKNEDNLWLATAKTSPSSPVNHNNLGDYYARQGNLPKAIEEFQEAIAINPQYGDAYHNLANTYRELGQEKEALENYQKATSFNPSLWQSYQNLGIIYYQQGNFQIAYDNIEKAIQLNPADSNIHLAKAFILAQLGEKNKAKLEFEETLRLNPQDTRAKEALLSF